MVMGGGGTDCVECVRDVAAGKEGLMMFSMVGHQISMTNKVQNKQIKPMKKDLDCCCDFKR